MLDEYIQRGFPGLLAPDAGPPAASSHDNSVSIEGIVNAAVRCVTNAVINRLPPQGVRPAWYRRMLGWRVGPNTVILRRQTLIFGGRRRDGARVSIGSDTWIGRGCLLSVSGGLVIGDEVCISPGVRLLGDPDAGSAPAARGRGAPTVIENYAWIGPNATVRGGVTIGEGAVVLAGALVSRDVAPYAIVGGAPASVVGRREPRMPSLAVCAAELDH